MRLPTAALVAALCACSSHGEDTPSVSKETATNERAPNASFLFVSQLGPHTGGKAGTSETVYIAGDGLVQVSAEATDGTLRAIRHATLSTDGFFEQIAHIPSSEMRVPTPRGEPGDLTDFYPPQLAVAWLTPSGDYQTKSFRRDALSARLTRLVEQTTALRQSEDLVDAEPGIYVRVQRIPSFDPRVQAVDLALQPEEIQQHPRLSAALQREMGFVRVGDLGETVRVAGTLELRPGRPVHIQVGDLVYRFITFATIHV